LKHCRGFQTLRLRRPSRRLPHRHRSRRRLQGRLSRTRSWSMGCSWSSCSSWLPACLARFRNRTLVSTTENASCSGRVRTYNRGPWYSGLSQLAELGEWRSIKSGQPSPDLRDSRPWPTMKTVGYQCCLSAWATSVVRPWPKQCSSTRFLGLIGRHWS